MGKLADIRNTALISRFEVLALATFLLIDKTVHAAGEVLFRGTLMGKIVATGKYRAYAEATVKAGGAFSNAAVGFTLDAALSPLLKYFRVGDVIESTTGTALGTIATLNPVTGVGTLTGNSANNLAAGQKVRITLATLALADSAGKILQDEVTCDGDDMAGTGFFEGFFLESKTTVTSAALTALGGVTVETGEIRLK